MQSHISLRGRVCLSIGRLVRWSVSPSKMLSKFQMNAFKISNDADFNAPLGIYVAWGAKCRGEVRHAMGIAKTLFGSKM